MIHNFTTDHQVNHRSIRQFKDQSLTAEQLTTLYEAARHFIKHVSSAIQHPTLNRSEKAGCGP